MKVEVAIRGEVPWYLEGLVQEVSPGSGTTAGLVQFSGTMIAHGTVEQSTGFPIALEVRRRLTDGTVPWIGSLRRVPQEIPDEEWAALLATTDKLPEGEELRRLATECWRLLIGQFLATSREVLLDASLQEREIVGERVLETLALGDWMAPLHAVHARTMREDRALADARLRKSGLGEVELEAALGEWETTYLAAASAGVAQVLDEQIMAAQTALDEALRPKEPRIAQAVAAMALALRSARGITAERYVALRYQAARRAR